MNTYKYTCYYGRDRDDWRHRTIRAESIGDAVRGAQEDLYGTGYTLKRNSVHLIENQ